MTYKLYKCIAQLQYQVFRDCQSLHSIFQDKSLQIFIFQIPQTIRVLSEHSFKASLHQLLLNILELEDTYVDTLILINKLSKITQGKGDVTRFLAQHSVAMLGQCCNHSKQCRNNVATLCCAKICNLVTLYYNNFSSTFCTAYIHVFHVFYFS